MRSGVIFSAILHVIFFAVILFGLPSFYEKKLTEHSAIVVEILPIGEFTNVKPKAQKKVVPKARPKIPTSQTANVKPAQPDPTVKPKPKMSEPEPKPQTPKVVEKPKSEPKIVQKDVKPIAKPPPPKKEEKKVVKKEEPQEDLFGSVLKTIEDIESKPKEATKGEEVDFSDIEDMFNNSEESDYKPGLPLSESEKGAIIRQIMENWSTISFSGAKDVHRLTATLIITLDIEGNVKSIKRKDSFRYNSDPIYRALVDSAERAVRKSSPLKDLPPEKFAVKEGWREMEINFDPSQMMY
ncbi:MAG: hypothetical protein PQ612_00110 [Rickettsiales bacterium]|nr:hypothetical protein [Pseudomonadota bacterium]MDA0965681.1 hypothetical protein [Pseudomonadota bacterium]MDG4543005.1 hypothetical protein [Rickettsiales bacterium]MDG4544547.1 hypothetical protein [Rickettsiales bacterium]MDG4546669.1 hypothetical protein [Rickettsiales bacterium]